MAKVSMHLLAVLFVLGAVFGIGYGIYVLFADTVWIFAYGLPVEVRGIPKVVLGIFSFVPAALLVGLFVVMRRGGSTAVPGTSSSAEPEFK